MNCLICEKLINPGEQIFWGSQMECCGPGEIDCSSSAVSDGLMGAIHLSCLKVLSQPAKTPGTTPQDSVVPPDDESRLVERSDAISLLGV